MDADTAPDSWPENWPPPMPDASGFVAPPVPGIGAAVARFARAFAADPAGGARVAARALWLAAIAAICVPPQLLWRAMGWETPWAQRFLGWGARACGIRVRVIGQPVDRDVFYIANHLSWTDALILGGCTGAVFVAQHGIALWPGLAFLCRINDTIFVNRSDRMGVPAQIAAIRAVFAGRSRVAMFAEGTTSDGRRLLPFKAPLFAMLIPPPPGATVQPVVIDCDEAGRNLAWIGMETGAANSWRLLSRPGTWEARVHFLAPFSPAETPNRKALSARARGAIVAKLSETLGGRPVM
ncbi:lysophospholipid acyltransferase family protein [Sandarakinorhabdus sp.]|uniref:lysophospholipid acyltransferase family protein n=1 Tax=Sandarakinorhabdus sp. TaxID=1916663 RepID=UPI003F6E69BF